MLTVFTSLVGLTFSLEISQGLARFYSDSQDAAARVAYASTTLWFTVAAYTVFLVLGFLFAAPATLLLLDAQDRVPLFLVALFSIWANGLFGVVQMQLRYQLHSRDYAISSLANTFVSIGATIGFVLIWKLGVLGVILGQLVGRGFGSAIALHFARESYRFTFSREKLSEMLRFSLPMVPAGFGIILTLYIDRIAIKELMTMADVGIFGIAYRLVSILGLLVAGFQTALVPLIFNSYRLPSTPGEIARIFRFFVAAELMVLMGVSLYARELIALLATPAYYGAASVVALLASATLLSEMYIFAPGLAIAKRTSTVAIISVVGAVMNTSLNLSLIPIWGLRGSALANLLSAAVVFGIHMVYSQRYYPVPHRWRSLGLAAAIASTVIVAGSFLVLDPWANMTVKALLILFVVVAFLGVRIIEVAEVRRAFDLVVGRVALARG